MLYNEKQIPEILFMKHRHDDDEDYVDYEKNILLNSVSSYMFKNDTLNGFIENTQPLVTQLFDQHNIVKNFTNITVDRDYFKHKD